jgi:hypothetical protein
MASPKTPGNQLGRWAIHFIAYQNRVELLLTIMKTSRTADEAWRKICHEYNLKP